MHRICECFAFTWQRDASICNRNMSTTSAHMHLGTRTSVAILKVLAVAVLAKGFWGRVCFIASWGCRLFAEVCMYVHVCAWELVCVCVCDYVCAWVWAMRVFAFTFLFAVKAAVDMFLGLGAYNCVRDVHIVSYKGREKVLFCCIRTQTCSCKHTIGYLLSSLHTGVGLSWFWLFLTLLIFLKMHYMVFLCAKSIEIQKFCTTAMRFAHEIMKSNKVKR